MRRYQKLLPLLAVIAIVEPVNSQENPTRGLLYNQSEVHSLTYDCASQSGGVLSCEFIQSAVRPKATYADLPAALDRARKDFAKGPIFGAEDCKLNQTLMNILEGKEKAPKAGALEQLSTVQRRDQLALSQGVLQVCAVRTEASYLDLVRIGQDRDRRTCKVSSYSYKQTFRMPSEASLGKAVWLAQGKPEGPCGVVQLSRFESDQTKIGTSMFTNWRYVARKAITNPSGELLPGTSCALFDEKPYIYDWRSQENQLSCDYIEFSPL